MTQKTETWNRSVGWYSFDKNHVTFRKMVMNSNAKPILVKLEDPVETDLNDSDNEQRDADFYTFAKNTLDRNCIPAYRSMVRDLTRNGRRNPSSCSAIRSVKCSMAITFLQKEPVQQEQNASLHENFGITAI